MLRPFVFKVINRVRYSRSHTSPVGEPFMDQDYGYMNPVLREVVGLSRFRLRPVRGVLDEEGFIK